MMAIASIEIIFFDFLLFLQNAFFLVFLLKDFLNLKIKMVWLTSWLLLFDKIPLSVQKPDMIMTIWNNVPEIFAFLVQK